MAMAMRRKKMKLPLKRRNKRGARENQESQESLRMTMTSNHVVMVRSSVEAAMAKVAAGEDAEEEKEATMTDRNRTTVVPMAVLKKEMDTIHFKAKKADQEEEEIEEKEIPDQLVRRPKVKNLMTDKSRSPRLRESRESQEMAEMVATVETEVEEEGAAEAEAAVIKAPATLLTRPSRDEKDDSEDTHVVFD